VSGVDVNIGDRRVRLTAGSEFGAPDPRFGR
jgi:hypothetical protein